MIEACGLKKNKRPKEDPSVVSKKKGRKTKKNKRKNDKKRRRKNKRRRTRRAAKAKSGRQDAEDVSRERTGLIWPWLASVTISGRVTCSAFIISSRIVITVTKCFPSLQTSTSPSSEDIANLNNLKTEIVVIGQDEKVSNIKVAVDLFILSQNVGVTSSSDWHEEQRAVEELLVHPDCHPGDLACGLHI